MKKVKSVFLIANDYGESRCLESISKELKERGYQTTDFFGFGKAHLVLTDEVVQQALKTDLLVTAISEYNKTEVELAVVVRKQNPSMPSAVYAPGRYAFRNAGAVPLRDMANFLFIGNNDELKEAVNTYLLARVSAVGNILHEEFHPAMSVEEARQKAGVENSQKLIFVPGDKRLGINWPLFHSVIEAAHRNIVKKFSPLVAIGIHPGDNTYKPELYEDANKFSRDVPVKIFTRDVLSSSVLVTACDLMVTAVSSLATAAAFQRKPVIGFYFENLLIELERAQEGRKFEWEPERDMVAEVVRYGSVDLLAEAIARLLTPHGFRAMKALQEYHYPSPPVHGSTAKKIVDILENSGY